MTQPARGGRTTVQPPDSAADVARRWSPDAADLAALALTLLAFALRAFHIVHYGLSGDEAFGAVLVDRGLGAIIGETTSGDPHPPLFYSALKAWTLLAGDSELALRFIGLFCGVALIPLVYRLGRWLLPQPAPLVAAVWLTVHPYQIWYAHEARMYLPAALLSTLSVALLVRWLRHPGKGAIAVYAVATTLVLYTHYYAALLVVFENLFVFGLWVAERRGRRLADSPRLIEMLPVDRRPADRRPAEWVAAQVALALVFVPWLIAARKLVGQYNGLGWDGPGPALGEVVVRFTVGYTWDWSGNVAVGSAVAAVVVFGLVVGFWWRPLPGTPYWVGWLLCGWALFPLLAGIGGSFFRPMLTGRYLMVSVGAFALALGLGVALLWRFRWPIGALVFAVVLAVGGRSLANLYFDPSYARSGYDQLARYIADHGQPGDLVVVAGYTQVDMFWYYYRHRLAGKLPDIVLPRSDPLDPAKTLAEIDQLLGQYRGVWYIDTDTARYDRQHVIERGFSTSGHAVLDRWFLANRLVYFAGGRSAEIPSQLVARFGPDVALAGARLGSVEARPGEVALLDLLWETTRPVAVPLKVSVRLRDSAGHTILAIDREPGAGFLPTTGWETGKPVSDRYGIALPPSTPPGEYSIDVKLYDPAGSALASVDSAGKPLPGGATVARLKVAGEPVATPVDDRLTRSASAAFGPLQLIGYDPPPSVDLAPGQSVGLRFQWRPVATLGDARLRFELIDLAGQSVGGLETPVGPADYSPSRWQVGRPVSAFADLVVPPRAPTGQYHLRMAVVGASGGTLLGPMVDLGLLRVVAPTRDLAEPKPEHLRDARFGDVARLVGYDGPAAGVALKPGDRLELVLRWQAIGQADLSYKVFVHLAGPDGKLHGQQDQPPARGSRPTTGWLLGEAVSDPYEVALDADAPPGLYSVKVGLYDEASGKRLPVSEGGDELEVLRFTVSR